MEHGNDEHSILDKAYDSSARTINLLLQLRYNDAHNKTAEYIKYKLVKTIGK